MKCLQIPSSTSILKRLLEDPSLPEKIEAMSARDLAQLISQVGLEDSGEIIAFASTRQIELVFDEDLWRSPQAGADERFDASRFGVWLEILLELGPVKAAEKISEMDEDFLTMAFSSLVWAGDLDWLQESCEVNRRIEKAMESSLTHEIESFILFSRNHESWNALLTLIAELDANYHIFLNRILSRCANQLVDEAEAEGGLYEILTAEEQLADDVAYEREKRRETLGFVVPAEARAFLKLSEGPLEVPDHVSPRRFRASKESSPHALGASPSESLLPMLASATHRFGRVKQFLQENPANEPMQMEELTYLANVLMSGWDWDGQLPRPAKAMEIVLEVCEQGLEHQGGQRSFLEVFRSGWSKWKQSKQLGS